MSSTVVQPMPGEAESGDQIQVALEARLALQRSAVEKEPYPNLAVRKDRLQRAINILLKHEKRIVEAAQTDFGQRPEMSCLQSDLLFPITSLRHALRHVESWMKPEKRKADFPFNLLGVKTYVFYQPLGVVGIIAPWNVPFGLGYAPLAGALAAGNRAMIKPSELTPHTAAVMAEITEEAFSPEEVTVVEGGLEVATRFSALPFDHIIFTGSAPVARHIMRAAAENLTPVTLELGGKAPVIIAKGADIDKVVSKVVAIKLGNGGQVCMGVDHIMVHHSDRDAFIDALKRKVKECFPNYASNPDLTYVFLENQRQRLTRLVKDAAERGALVDIISGASIEQLPQDPNFPLTLIVDPPLAAAVMREEIFGPVLPIVSYDTLEEAAEQVRSRERPLALYFFGGSKQEQDFILRNTWAGGVSFDDLLLHVFMEDLPFGGVGESGMGRYGGHAGYKTFSNPKAVAHRPWIDLVNMSPPFTLKMTKMVRSLLGRPG